MATRKLLLPEEVIIQVIEEIKNRECIWNPDHSKYSDRYYVLSSWKEISQKFQISEDILKVKWKHLRDIFRKEMKKSNIPYSVQDYKGRWKYFSHMWFLNVPGIVKPIQEISQEVTQEEPDSSPETRDIDPFYELVKKGTHVQSFIKFEDDDEREDEIEEIQIEGEEIQNPAKKRRYNDDEYDMMFLKSLMPFFRQLDPLRKLVVRSKIQNMLLSELTAEKTETCDKSNNDS